MLEVLWETWQCTRCEWRPSRELRTVARRAEALTAVEQHIASHGDPLRLDQAPELDGVVRHRLIGVETPEWHAQDLRKEAGLVEAAQQQIAQRRQEQRQARLDRMATQILGELLRQPVHFFSIYQTAWEEATRLMEEWERQHPQRED